MKSLKKTISVLGSTGSIGTNTLDIVRRSGGEIAVAGLAAGQNIELLAEQVREFRPECVSVMSEELAGRLREMIPAETEVMWGKDGCKQVASLDAVDMTVSAMVGAAGLIPTVAAMEAGKDIALANKETLVAAGPLVTRLAKERDVRMLPVDSEHSAIFQCLQAGSHSEIKRLVLTASGGPFRKVDPSDFPGITPEQAVNHPKWSMGAKISVDSSTLMNKGLEVIEARWLFDVPVNDIDVAVHPQSIIHSMVEYADGSVIAQLGMPDMRIPISIALYWPERMELDLPSLDLFTMGDLTFEPPRLDDFPCLRLAFQAAEAEGNAPTALNASNEIAVDAFLQGRIGYLDIARVSMDVLDSFPVEDIHDLDDVLQADALARVKAEGVVQNISEMKR
jgi:1-deoxy-D-xylulose-5-phosphate reductoisomerase